MSNLAGLALVFTLATLKLQSPLKLGDNTTHGMWFIFATYACQLCKNVSLQVCQFASISVCMYVSLQMFQFQYVSLHVVMDEMT